MTTTLVRLLPVQPAVENAAAALHAAFEGNDLASAERLVGQLIVGPPKLAIDALTRLGLMRRRAGQIGSAIEAFLEASNVVAQPQAMADGARLPDWFHSELSGCYVQQGTWSAALAWAQAGLSIKPVLGLTAATALARLGRIPEACQRLQAAVSVLALEPGRAAMAASTCRALLEAAPTSAVQVVVRHAAAAWPNAPVFAEVRAMLAILHRFAGPEVDPAEATAAVAEAAVLAAPDSEGAMFRWRDLLARTRSNEAITEAMAALQTRTPVVLPALMVQLSRRMSMDTLLRRFASQIEEWRQSPSALACAAYHEAVCHLKPPAPGVIEELLAVSESQLRLFLLLREPRLRTIQVRNPSDVETALLAEAGVSVAAVQAFLADVVGSLDPAWATYLDRAAFASAEAKRIVQADEGFSAFQDRIVRDQAFAMIDPIGGGPVDLFDSVKIHDRQLFAFRGTELIIVQTGGNMNFLLFIHLVSRNLVLLVDSRTAPSKQAFYASDTYVAEVQAVWLRRAARNHEALLDAAQAAPEARGRRRRIVAIHGRAENPAHHVWNYMPAFERLVIEGTIGNIGAVLTPPTHYFGPLPAIFPELAQAELLTLPETPAIDPCPFSTTAIALQLGSSFIPTRLMHRIHGWAERITPKRSTVPKERHPIVWIGLRVGDKVWVDQVAGIATIIDHVVPLYPQALFVLDGFSLPDGAEAAPDKWREATEGLTQAAADIRNATVHPEAVLSLVGNRISESVLWARAAHAYLTPLGSSQHKVGWYGTAPGLVYTSPNLARIPPARRQGAWEAEGCSVPDFLIGTIAAPGQRRGTHDYRTNLETIAFPAHVAARRLIAILARREFSEDDRPSVLPPQTA